MKSTLKYNTSKIKLEIKLLIVVFFIWSIFSIKGFAQESFTIEQVMSSNFPSSLTTSSSNDMAAWVQNKNGVRNIYISDGTQFPKKITAFTKDDGQAISNLIFTPDNKHLFFVRGAAPNNKGEVPNPLSLPNKVKREIWQINLQNDSLKLISEGAYPSLSHNGEILVFIHKKQVWKVDFASDEKPTLLFSIRGSVGSLKWSPDDAKVAFVSNRSTHSFVGVYDLLKKEINYLSPSVDYDSNPVWSLNSKKIAFIRMPREAKVIPFMPRRTALPWSIHIGNIQNKTSKEIWKANTGMGSAFRSISASNQLLWTANNFIIFPWEKQGWTHLYAIKSDGSILKQLTSGKFEVKYASISHNNKTIVYSSNQGDIDRHHIWQVTVADGKNKQLTKGTGIEWAPQLTGTNNKLFFVSATATSPAQPTILNNGKMKLLRNPSDLTEFPKGKLVEPKQIIFTAADGMQIHGQLFLPPKMKKDKKYPAVIYTHGGSRRQMFLGFHHSGYYHNAYAFNQFLANRGYIVLSVNYRSGIGYGMEFREALNYGARGASEFQDVLGAGIYLRNRADVDAKNIGLWGGSYGGFLTAMGLARASNLFAAGVDIHGVHDWNVVIGNFVSGYDPAKSKEAAKLAFDSSPIAYIKDWKSPVLLIHGDDDRNVPFGETVDLVEALRKNNVEFEQLIFPDEVHGFLLHSNWIKAFTASYDFFERKLKNQ